MSSRPPDFDALAGAHVSGCMGVGHFLKDYASVFLTIKSKRNTKLKL